MDGPVFQKTWILCKISAYCSAGNKPDRSFSTSHQNKSKKCMLFLVRSLLQLKRKAQDRASLASPRKRFPQQRQGRRRQQDQESKSHGKLGMKQQNPGGMFPRHAWSNLAVEQHIIMSLIRFSNELFHVAIAGARLNAKELSLLVWKRR